MLTIQVDDEIKFTEIFYALHDAGFKVNSTPNGVYVSPLRRKTLGMSVEVLSGLSDSQLINALETRRLSPVEQLLLQRLKNTQPEDNHHVA